MTDNLEMRQAAVDELNEILSHLDNGSVADPEWHGKGIRFILRHLRYLLMRETVTESECSKRMADFMASCAARHSATPAIESPSIMLTKEALRWVPAPVLLFLYVVGKGNGWW